MTLELKKFDMRNIKFNPDENNGPVVVLIGRRDTGKSYLVRDLIFYHQDIPIGTVISGTEAGNGFYGSHVPKLFIHDEYNTAIIENILKRFPTFESFCQVMDQCTENYECLVVNNNAKSNKLQDQIFWYKAEPHGDFKLGSKEFWDISKDLNSDDEDDSYDPNSSKKRGAGPKISVKKSRW